MRGPFAAAVLGAVVACGSFESAGDSGDAGTTDAGTSADAGGGGDAGRPQFGCAAVPVGVFLLCSDFDSAQALDQPTQPDARLWDPQKAQPGDISIGAGRGLGGSNALAVSAAGSGSVGQLRMADIVIKRGQIRLKMKLRALTLPGPGDVFIAGLNFDNVKLALVLHATGTVVVAQTPTGEPVDKNNPPNPEPIGVDNWKSVELLIDRRAGRSEVEARVEGNGTPTTLAATPAGNAQLTVGIGYCDGDCGNAKLEIDDVVLTEE